MTDIFGTNDFANIDQSSANSIITNFFAQFGLKGLTSNAWQQFLDGQPISEILLNVRNTPEYKQRFSGMTALQQAGHAISEAQYVSNEASMTQQLVAAGIPRDSGFYDQQYLGKVIGSQISPAEFGSRVDMAKAAANSNPEVIAELRARGASDGALYAFFLDPDKGQPIIERQLASANIGAQAKLTGYGAIGIGQADRLASDNITPDQAQKGFGDLAAQHELFSNQGTENDQTIGTDQQLAATFEGNYGAQQRIAKKAAQRKSGFGSQAAFSETKSGASGLGTASQSSY